MVSGTLNVKDFFTLDISKDLYSAELTCSIPDNFKITGKNIHYIAAELMTLLIENDILLFNGEKISAILEKIKNECRYVSPEVIAEGIKPQNGKDAFIKWVTETKKENNQDDSPDRVNLRDKSSKLYTVIQDQIIGVKYVPTPGIPGRKINNDTVPARPGKDIKLKINAGITTEEHKDKTVFKAAVDGHLVVRDNYVAVEETLLIDGNVDYSVGNIYYFKDVIITGNVLSGFKIETKGSVTIDGFVENGVEISADGDICVGKGVIGKETSLRAGKKIKAFYVHFARLHSEDEILIKKFALDANLYAKNRIEVMGEDLKKGRSAVIGSVLSSDQGVYIPSIGSDLAAPSFIRMCDIAERVKKEFGIVKDYQKRLLQIVRTLDVNFKSPLFVEALKNMNSIKKEAYKKLMTYIKDLIDEIRRNKAIIERTKKEMRRKVDSAEVVIPHNIIPPLTVIFNEKILKLRSRRSGQKFVYDKNQRIFDSINI